ncbi:MAG: hypothetical protein ACFFAN_11525 [Promethearchaeota archaeon]
MNSDKNVLIGKLKKTKTLLKEFLNNLEICYENGEILEIEYFRIFKVLVKEAYIIKSKIEKLRKSNYKENFSNEEYYYFV